MKLFMYDILGVSLWAFRCAHAHKVGVLRAALRFGATHWANAHPSHASRKNKVKFTSFQSLISIFRLRFLNQCLIAGICFYILSIQTVDAQRVYEDEPVDANISRINFIEPPITLELPNISQIVEQNNNKSESSRKVILPKYTGAFVDKIPDFDHFRLRERRLNQEGKNFKGYRVQIYSGLDNNEAQRIRSDFILKQQGKYNTYNSYEQPYYRIRVGDFVQYWHARKLQQEILKDFPNAMIVQDNIHLPSR